MADGATGALLAGERFLPSLTLELLDPLAVAFNLVLLDGNAALRSVTFLAADFRGTASFFFDRVRLVPFAETRLAVFVAVFLAVREDALPAPSVAFPEAFFALVIFFAVVRFATRVIHR